MLRPSLPYSDPDDPSIRLAYPLDKQIFDMNILIVVNLLEKNNLISYTIYRAARMLVTTKRFLQDLVLTDWQRIGSGSPGVELRGQVAGEEV